MSFGRAERHCQGDQVMAAVIFDTETTGKNDPKLVEAAGIVLDGDGVEIDLRAVARYCERYNPGKPIEPGALATHHILDEDVASCPPAESFNIHDWFASPDDFVYLIGHNVDYDWDVIGKPDCRRIDTLALYRRFFPELDSHSLGAVVYFILPHEQARRLLKDKAHGGAADCEATRHILLKCLAGVKKMGFPLTWEGLWQCSEECRIPTHFPFGKHRGVPLSELPRDYVDWCLRNLSDIDPYLRDALNRLI